MACIEMLMNIIASIGTLIAALIALFTLLEIKMQRKESNKPELAIRGKLIFIYSIKYKDYYLPFLFSDSEIYSQEREEGLSNCKLDVVNVGIRSAKNVKCEWEFDFESAIDSINRLDSDRLFDFNLCNQRLVVAMDKAGYKKYTMIENVFRIQQFDFILNSVTGSYDTVYLYIPTIVLEFFTIKHCLLSGYYKSDEISPSHTSDIEFPKPIVKIYYEDISGIHYNKKYVFDVNLMSFTNPMNGSSERSVGELTIVAMM